MAKKKEAVKKARVQQKSTVGAASSVVLSKIKKKYGDIGSGYPADPVTKVFLQENWDKHPEIFRKTWASYKKMVSQKSQKGLGDF